MRPGICQGERSCQLASLTMEEPGQDSYGIVHFEYSCLPTLGINCPMYHKGTKLASSVEFFNLCNFNNVYGMPQIMVFKIIFVDLFFFNIIRYQIHFFFS